MDKEWNPYEATGVFEYRLYLNHDTPLNTYIISFACAVTVTQVALGDPVSEVTILTCTHY